MLHPAFKLKNRVDKLEINVENDYKSIKEIRDMQSLLCQGMIALIDNRITGNNIEGLKKNQRSYDKAFVRRYLRSVALKVYDFTVPELNYFRTYCNFIG